MNAKFKRLDSLQVRNAFEKVHIWHRKILLGYLLHNVFEIPASDPVNLTCNETIEELINLVEEINYPMDRSTYIKVGSCLQKKLTGLAKTERTSIPRKTKFLRWKFENNEENDIIPRKLEILMKFFFEKTFNYPVCIEELNLYQEWLKSQKTQHKKTVESQLSRRKMEDYSTLAWHTSAKESSFHLNIKMIQLILKSISTPKLRKSTKSASRSNGRRNLGTKKSLNHQIYRHGGT